MKCNKCGQDYQGNFCPNCGTPAPGNAEAPKRKKKIRWWHIILIILLLAILGNACNGSSSDSSEGDMVSAETDQQQSSEQDETESPNEADPESSVSSGETTQEPDATANLTTGQKNALASAAAYLNYTAFSYNGLIGQLEYEGLTHDEAVYGGDNCGASCMEKGLVWGIAVL